jgi:hypothetical protein
MTLGNARLLRTILLISFAVAVVWIAVTVALVLISPDYLQGSTLWIASALLGLVAGAAMFASRRRWGRRP